eukprot:IDg4202t1
MLPVRLQMVDAASTDMVKEAIDLNGKQQARH